MAFHLLPWSFCGRLNCFPSYIIFCNYNLFWSELKSECIWRVKFRPRELYEVRVVHSKTCLHERCSFNFVFLRISLATENALIEILKKIIYNVCKNILARMWCSLFVLSSLVEGLQSVYLFVCFFFVRIVTHQAFKTK